MRVAVIGAGFSGLAAVKTCLDENVEVICFERESEIGGVWRYSEGGEKGSVCRSTVINTCKEMMSFSDFPIPNDFPMYMHNSKVMEYALSYVNRFDLLPHIKFDTNVIGVVRADDYDTTGQWMVTHQKCGKEITNQVTDCFDAVLICSGHHWKINYPSFKGMNTFQGTQMHSKQYRDVKGFENKTVVVVGFGNSGGDIAVDLSKYAKNVFLSTRRGAWISSRYVKGYPRDKYYNRRFLLKAFPHWLKSKVADIDINNRFDHVAYGLKPEHNSLAQHPTVNEHLPPLILSGLIKVKPNIKEIEKNNVVFEDGTVINDVDCIIYCTGFEFGFPFVEENVLQIEKNRLPCYKLIFPSSLKRHTLAVIGFIQPLGAIMPISEMQCRVALKVFTKKCKLPERKEILKEIESRKEEMQRVFYDSPRHTIQVNYIAYMDELADMIGCMPAFWSLLFSDPRVWYQWYFGACVPFQYRLFGPNTWKGAREAVLQTEILTYQANSTRITVADPRSFLSRFSSIVLLVLIAIFAYYLLT